MALAGACRRETPPSSAADGSVARALFDVERDLGDRASAAGVQAVLRELASAIRAAIARDPARPVNVASSEAFFQTAGFVRETEDQDERFVFLSPVLTSRRGSCVGLGTAFLAAAELAGVRARGVVLPGHFYVQIEDRGRWRNFELLRRGEEMPDEWYRGKYGAAPGSVAGRALEAREVVGVVAFNVGNERRRQQRFAEARRAYERAVRESPGFAEAHASLGATLQLTGALDEAAAAYARARALDPALPGLARNIELLEAERAKRDSGAGRPSP